MEQQPINVDLDRQRRCGFPEVVFGPGKTVEQLREIVRLLLQHGQPVLATRIDESQAAGLSEEFSGGRYNAVARTFRVEKPGTAEPSSNPTRHGSSQASLGGRGSSRPHVAIISAGTGDLPVAEEARETRFMLQVNVSGEESKAGMTGEELAAAGLELPVGTRLIGLMTMAPLGVSHDDARAVFRRLKELRDRMEQANGIGLPELSMGMTADADAAAAEGATLVRIGTALFGPRT